MSKITYEEEELDLELANELMPLLELHRQELSAYQDMKLNVDVYGYITMYNMGMYKCFIARNESQHIVGYLCYTIARNMHYNDYTIGIQDVLYVDKSARGAMIGSRLIAFSDDIMKNKYGVNVVSQHVKTKHDMESIMKRNGYTWIEKIYSKRLN